MKNLKLSAAQKEQLLQKCQEKIFTDTMTELGKTFSITLNLAETLTAAEKPTVLFTPIAYLKINKLVKTVNYECGWHGVVSKEGNVYTIHDILVYPQEATAATVESNDAAYALWQDSLPDAVYNNIRLQGHSHVNMGVTPSSVDEANRKTFLNVINKETGYYIFMIVNKHGLCNMCLYDMAQQVMFENEDITIDILLDTPEQHLEAWTTEAIKNVVHRSPVRTVLGGGTLTTLSDDDGYDYYERLYGRESTYNTSRTYGKTEAYELSPGYLDFCKQMGLPPNAEDFKTWCNEFDITKKRDKTRYKGVGKNGPKQTQRSL